jgi:hypothetical protein
MAQPDLSSLSIEELNGFIAEATRVRDRKVEEKKAELLKQIAELDALKASPVSSDGIRRRAPRKKLYRHPVSGNEYGNTSEIPREFKELGVTDKAGLEKYRITD